MIEAVERLAAFVLFLTGLSHLVAPRAWLHLFGRIRAQEDAAGILLAAVHAPLGLLIAAMHPVWSGAGLLVTLIGWALLLKSLAYLLSPAHAMRVLDASLAAGERPFRLGGLLLLPIAALVAWIALAP
jgi:uncharacterized protein YjeT (DUF2065 family)